MLHFTTFWPQSKRTCFSRSRLNHDLQLDSVCVRDFFSRTRTLLVRSSAHRDSSRRPRARTQQEEPRKHGLTKQWACQRTSLNLKNSNVRGAKRPERLPVPALAFNPPRCPIVAQQRINRASLRTFAAPD